MSAQIHSTQRDLTGKQTGAGPGLPHRWLCIGRNQVRSMVGSRGAGIRKVCAECVAKPRAHRDANR